MEKTIRAYRAVLTFLCICGFLNQASAQDSGEVSQRQREMRAEAAFEKGIAWSSKGRQLADFSLQDSAILYFDQAIYHFTALEKWVDVGWTHSRKVRAHYFASRTPETERALKDMLAFVAEKEKELTPPTVVSMRRDVYNFLAIISQSKGDYVEAVDFMNRAIDLTSAQAALGSRDSSFIAVGYHNLGVFYKKQGDYVRALDQFRRADRFHARSQFDNVVRSYNVGSTHLQLGNYQECIRYTLRSLELDEDKGDNSSSGDRARALSNLASAYRCLGEFETAEQYCREALNMQRNRMRFLPWATIGRIHLEQADPEGALGAFRQSLALYNARKTETFTFFAAEIYRLLGDAFSQNDQLDSALYYYREALISNHPDFRDRDDLLRNPQLSSAFDPVNFLETLEGKARTLAKRPDDDKYATAALATYALAFDWLDALNGQYRTEASQLDWSDRYYDLSEAAVGFVYDLYRRTGRPEYLDYAFVFMERSRNGILREQLRAAEGVSYGGVPESVIDRENLLQLRLADYRRELRRAELNGDVEGMGALENRVSEARESLAEFRDTLITNYPRYEEFLRAGAYPSPRDIQGELLARGSAFITYLLGEKRSFVCVIEGQTTKLLELTTSAEIRQAVDDWKKQTFDFSYFERNANAAVADYNRVSKRLYDLVLLPVVAELKRSTNRLFVVPDGALHAVPFSTLTMDLAPEAGMDFDRLPFVLKHYRVQYAYSADLQLESRERTKRLPHEMNCLAMAPTYPGTTGSSRSGFSPSGPDQLTGTVAEVEAIQKIFRGTFLTGDSASKHRFLASAPNFGVLHLAMHGVADQQDPSYNHLLFGSTTADTSSSEHLLFHHDIANLSLSAWLAVLSACETGVGRLEQGEGVYSLARSFFSAGVPSVVMSLWRAEDSSTSQMMPLFYKRLAAGDTKDEALSRAKADYLSSAKLEFRHPYYWATFVGLGDAAPVKRNGYWWVAIPALLALLLPFGWRRWRIKQAVK